MTADISKLFTSWLPTHHTATMTAKLFVATLLLGSTAACAQAATLPHVLKRQTPIATAGAPQVSGSAGSPNATTPSTPSNGTAPVADSGCVIDQSQAPQDLTLCGNATLFNVWRSKSHVVGREGWINDPMAIYETERDGQPVRSARRNVKQRSPSSHHRSCTSAGSVTRSTSNG